MYINVNSDGHKIKLMFPTGLIFNPVTAHIAAGCIKGKAGEKLREEDLPLEITSIDAGTLSKLFRVINLCRKRFPDWYIVEVDSADGDVVRIKL